MAEIKEFEIYVYGRVQGIGFRRSVQIQADALGLSGYAENLPNGNVHIVVQGNEHEIEQFISWLKSSPGFTSVDEVKVQNRKVFEPLQGFNIMRENNIILDKAKSLVNLGRRITGTEKSKVPMHVAIIPDGNRRWATEKGLEPSFGHYKSASYENIISLLNESKSLGIKYISFWGFSTENWNRNQMEVKAIFDLVSDLIARLRKDAKENKVRFRHIGRKDRLPEKLVQEIKQIEEETKNYLDINVQLCLDYGGRDEILRALNKMLRSGNKNINEETMKENLDTFDIPDPDLIIRTSGEKRLSGFMPFQSVYAELYFTEVYFPDFDALELRKAVEEFSRRQRRFGGN